MKKRSVLFVILACLLLFAMPSAANSSEDNTLGKMPIAEESAQRTANQEIRAKTYFNAGSVFVQKTYLVTVKQPVTDNVLGKVFVTVSRGSGFVLELNDKLYFVTANHVINVPPANDEPNQIIFTDYKGNNFKTTLLHQDEYFDVALFDTYDSVKNIRKETIIKKLASANIEDTVNTCGNVMFLKAFFFPVCLEKTVKGKIELNVSAAHGSFTMTYVILHTGLEFGFSGGPTMNKNGELIGINDMVTKAGQFGILVGDDNDIRSFIESYEKGRNIAPGP
jgi:S1-C subfamily serine protease